jgi:hypothetical protein
MRAFASQTVQNSNRIVEDLKFLSEQKVFAYYSITAGFFEHEARGFRPCLKYGYIRMHKQCVYC